LEFIINRKSGVKISSYFIDQLEFLERSLKENHNRRMSHDWEDNGLLKENEIILNNTYLNGVVNHKNILRAKMNFTRSYSSNSPHPRKIKWADNNYSSYSHLTGNQTTVPKYISRSYNRVYDKLPIKSSIKIKNNPTNGLEHERSSRFTLKNMRSKDPIRSNDENYKLSKNNLHNIRSIINNQRDLFENNYLEENYFSSEIIHKKNYGKESLNAEEVFHKNEEVRKFKEKCDRIDKITGIIRNDSNINITPTKNIYADISHKSTMQEINNKNINNFNSSHDLNNSHNP